MLIVPLRFESAEKLRQLSAQVDGRAEILELWLDRYEPSEEEIQALKNEGYQLLGVCKTELEKGSFTGNPEARCEVLKRFLNHGGDLMDLDVMRNPGELINQFPSENLILSFHDFRGMPDGLEILAERMASFEPKIYKFAITANDETDLEQFSAFVQTWPDHKPAIFTTMGTLGREGREQIKELGKSWAQFVALSEEYKTAEGQRVL